MADIFFYCPVGAFFGLKSAQVAELLVVGRSGIIVISFNLNNKIPQIDIKHRLVVTAHANASHRVQLWDGSPCWSLEPTGNQCTHNVCQRLVLYHKNTGYFFNYGTVID